MTNKELWKALKPDFWDVFRVIGTVVLVYGVFKETGMFTGAFAFLVALSMECQRIILRIQSHALNVTIAGLREHFK